jgi:type II secretory pathway pseudopilin PulG
MLPHSPIRRSREQGYIMMTLILIMALMAIFAGVIASSISFEIKRDREEEMIHRGTQYSRAIRAYYKKLGRYPAKIEDLENTSQQRFLRKRYKDPLNCSNGKCADFKLLHYGEAKMSMGGIGGGVIPGASTLGPNGTLTTGAGLAQTSAFGGNNSFGATSSSSFGQNSFAQNSPTTNTPSATGDTPQPGMDPGTQSPAGGTGASPSAPGSNLNNNSGDKLSNTTFGGAPIVGVASTSKEKTIREFDHKKKYNEWQFVYDPMLDRGFLITTPYQPQLQQFGMQGVQNLNGQLNPGQNGSNTGFGNNTGNGFGNSFGNSPSGMQNNPAPPPGSGYGNPSQPSNPPQQQ